MSARERVVVAKYSHIKYDERSGVSDLLVNTNLSIYVAVGCEKCSGTGYFGRTVVAEILPITPQLGQMIVEKRVMSAPIKTIGHQAVMKYLQGITSFDEVMKILHE
jgi:type II secretory ATPase GspE/PulE/Tfp pilus assembly ATPase PilB-like protein